MKYITVIMSVIFFTLLSSCATFGQSNDVEIIPTDTPTPIPVVEFEDIQVSNLDKLESVWDPLIFPDSPHAISWLDDGNETLVSCFALYHLNDSNNLPINFGQFEEILPDVSNCVSVSPDLVASNEEGSDTVEIWSIRENELVKTIKVEDVNSNLIYISPDSKYLGTIAEIDRLHRDGKAQIWSIENGNEIGNFDSIQEIVFSPYNHLVALISDSHVVIWDLEKKY